MLLTFGVPLAPSHPHTKVKTESRDLRHWYFLPRTMDGQWETKALLHQWRAGMDKLAKTQPDSHLAWLRGFASNTEYLIAMEQEAPQLVQLEDGKKRLMLNPNSPQHVQDKCLQSFGV